MSKSALQNKNFKNLTYFYVLLNDKIHLQFYIIRVQFFHKEVFITSLYHTTEMRPLNKIINNLSDFIS